MAITDGFLQRYQDNIKKHVKKQKINKRRSYMVYFEDINGCGHALLEADIKSIEQKEKDGPYILYRQDSMQEPIPVDEATYKSLVGFLAKDYEQFWDAKMDEFSGMLDDGSDVKQEGYTLYNQPYYSTSGSGSSGLKDFSNTIASTYAAQTARRLAQKQQQSALASKLAGGK